MYLSAEWRLSGLYIGLRTDSVCRPAVPLLQVSRALAVCAPAPCLPGGLRSVFGNRDPGDSRGGYGDSWQ